MPSFNFADILELVVDEVPDREAVVCGDRRVTYREFDERVNRLAHWLAEQGVGRGDHVGLYLTNGTEYLEAWFAAAKLGAVGINVNYRYVEDELRYLFNDAQLVAVVHDAQFAERIDHVAPDCPTLRVRLAVDRDAADNPYEAALAASSPERDFAERSPDDLYILYTGGTTGMPKGVMWRQEDAFFACMRGGNPLGVAPETPEAVLDVIRTKGVQAAMVITPPLMHGAAQWTAGMQLFGGDKIVLDPSSHMDPARIWRLVSDEKATSMVIVGDAMGRPLAEELDRADYDLSTFFVLGSGGAILSDTVKGQLRAKLPHILIMDSFGVSETGFQGQRPSTAGNDDGGPRFAMDDTTAVLDDDLRPVAPGSGVQGHLARGGRIPLGYWGDEEKSAKTFVTDADGKRWSLPGDMALVEDDGTIVLLGRGNQCINTGGEKVFPEEVEAALKSHPDVFDAIVVGVPDDRWGQRVAAVVQPRDGARPELDALAEHAREHVAGYKVPRQLVLVDAVVRSPSGKPDYRWAKAVASE